MVTAVVMGLPGSGRTSLAVAMQELGVTTQEIQGAIGDEGLASDALPADAIVLVCASARDGINAELARTWESLAEQYVPRMLVWTFSDVGRADDDDMRAIAERVLGEPTTAVALPLADDDDEFAGVLDLRDWRILDASGSREADAEHRDAAGALRDELIDAVLTVVDDEAAVTQRMSGMEPSASRLHALVAKALRSGQFVPSMAVKAPAPSVGIEVLADILRSTAE